MRPVISSLSPLLVLREMRWVIIFFWALNDAALVNRVTVKVVLVVARAPHVGQAWVGRFHGDIGRGRQRSLAFMCMGRWLVDALELVNFRPLNLRPVFSVWHVKITLSSSALHPTHARNM